MTVNVTQSVGVSSKNRAIHVINGPNLDLLGRREPEIYGSSTLHDIEVMCREAAEAAGIELAFLQSNAEHEIIGWIHEAIGSAGLVINPAAFGHSSYAIYDALNACDCPIVEVHLSNIYARPEPWRRQSVVSGAATGVISGLGTEGYLAAIRFLASRLDGHSGRP